MHLILTHEQADFDAVASALGAHMRSPSAMIVLPRRVNRNVRAYLTLYGDDLPFVDFDDLPREQVEKITLVDTQTLASLKRLSPDLEVNVIDHHPRMPDLDPKWTVTIEDVGATTTILVEHIQKTGLHLDSVAATLLLLGIYEDTGSLSYVGTGARDVRACAWLLERGASLAVAADFLNHPLSTAQRQLYDRLLDGAETHEIEGLSIVVAGASAEGMEDEISTLAHKLRDLFDPEGLFVLVDMDGRVQLVARSTTDALDVARVAEHFGGGGHGRAAAALIRGRSRGAVRDELLAFLPSIIRPATTVEEIMSRDPQLLTRDVVVSDAFQRMQRFGHEGYPVVDRGQVVGLLTRRAVDRAIAHGMSDEHVGTIMDAGNLVVRPDDSIQHLQRMMIQQDWGQVPVEDPATGDIIGIVTRTDLLKAFGSEQVSANGGSLADKLKRALSPFRLRLLRLVASAAEEHGDALYVVGGFVRDLILDAPGTDFDLVVEGNAIGLARLLVDRFGGRVSSHRRFGTAKWRLDPADPHLIEALQVNGSVSTDVPATLDFVSARTEFYTYPTALPSVEPGSIKLDLHRRDFTINTMALRLDGPHYGQLIDHWGGGRDLHERKIRVLHSLSFVDDPTRMLRAIRLEQRLGFAIEDRTLELMHQALPLLDRVSGERIRSELDLIFSEAKCVAIMGRLQELGLLKAIHPSISWDEWLTDRYEAVSVFEPPEEWKLHGPPDRGLLRYALLLIRLPEEAAGAVLRRLHFPSGRRDVVLEANDLARRTRRWNGQEPPSRISSMLDKIHETAIVTAWLAATDRPRVQGRLVSYMSDWRWIAPAVDGMVLRRSGLAPGPIYGEILGKLRDAWLDGKIQNSGDEQAFLRQLLEEAGSGG
jgi:tRNA nucleotidyltransferase (CCA-adding enzyme)